MNVVHDGVIQFKSEMYNYWQEFSGSKRNTVRTIPETEFERFGLRIHDGGYMTASFRHGVEIVQCIEIVCVETNQRFRRELRNVTEHDGKYIFSW